MDKTALKSHWSKGFGVYFSLLLGVLLASQASALALKHDPRAARGCIKPLSLDEAKLAMKRFNIRTTNGTNKEMIALGTGLMWLEELNGGKPLDLAVHRGENGFPFVFHNQRKSSNQTPWAINIARKSNLRRTPPGIRLPGMPRGNRNFGENVAQLIHELGHYVGNYEKNGIKAYGYRLYRKHMKGQYCIVSGYSDDRFNEQFAEVFAAFVTQPGKIKNNGSVGCRRAWQFFTSGVLFKTGEKATACMKGQADKVLTQRPYPPRKAALGSLASHENEVEGIEGFEERPPQKELPPPRRWEEAFSLEPFDPDQQAIDDAIEHFTEYYSSTELPPLSDDELYEADLDEE